MIGFSLVDVLVGFRVITFIILFKTVINFLKEDGGIKEKYHIVGMSDESDDEVRIIIRFL